MPRTKSNADADTRAGEPEVVGSNDNVNGNIENDNEESVEEEVEYEEVEVEVEEDEEEDDEEEEVEVEEEVSEDEDEEHVGNGDEHMADADMNDVKKKHAELLALPPHGSEVYLGGFGQDISEDELRSFCESAGEVTQIRIMKGRTSTENKGYAFITFRTKEMASKAMETLNNSELKGRKLRCSSSQEKNKLFIGNVPKNWEEEDMRKAITKLGPGLTAIELLKDPHNSSRNRGFAFIEYYNHACAEYSREKMSDSNFKLDGLTPTVSWADPKNVESSNASQVKAVYVKNLPKNITQDQLRSLFEHHGKITKVVVPPAKPGHENSRYGFVHFADKSSALKVLKNTEKYEIDGQVLECSLAKPQADQKSSGQPSTQKAALLPSYPPPMGYGMVGAGYGTFGSGFAQPLAPSGLAMLPMLLPDGRIGYVLQQPTAQSHTVQPQPMQRGGGSGGGTRGSGGGRRGNDRGRGRSRYNPY
ncbi:OLC1v1034192C1 [Oldenlandia corymbosa var. corymbosa]|uniref:OLC1v1034192C1 n=1 Tax=Oldenlandia corymbosa var. corymbosa TaxID=529605 RepID=A0AAV1CSN2_OLDCO|nr:OLC1v1034192C1 [Oldenlandia corymbosa var. corymbosa]